MLARLAQFRAKNGGKEYTLTDADVEALQTVIDAGFCQVTGVPFNLDDGKTWDSPSLDRIDSTRGYVAGNVRVVLYAVNVMANVWGENKILQVAEAIRNTRRAKSDDLTARLTARLKQNLSCETSMEFVQTWKEKATPSGRPYWEHTASGRRTSGSDCTGWPTPDASSANGGRMSKDPTCLVRPSGAKKMLTINDAAQMAGWATPSAQVYGDTPETHLARKEAARAEGKSMGLVVSNLFAQAHLAVSPWATPAARDGKGMPADGFNPSNLPTQAETSGPPTTSSPAGTGKRGALNPELARWLQGYPAAWGCSGATGIASCPKRRRRS